MESKPNVLFLCTGNSCRSQMAEGFLRALGGDRFDVYSAGTDPAEQVHPLAVEVMAEKGIDVSSQEPKGVDKYLGKLSPAYVIIVCEGAEKKCPSVFPGMIERMVWPFEDPAKFEGPPEAKLQKFREVRDQIERRISGWLREVSQ